MILVAGGTGLIGSELLRLLSQAGVPARALTRNPQEAQTLPGITWVAGDLARPETLTMAFEGARNVFLLTPLAPWSAGNHERRRDPAPLRGGSLRAAAHGPGDYSIDAMLGLSAWWTPALTGFVLAAGGSRNCRLQALSPGW